MKRAATIVSFESPCFRRLNSGILATIGHCGYNGQPSIPRGSSEATASLPAQTRHLPCNPTASGIASTGSSFIRLSDELCESFAWSRDEHTS